MAQMTRKILVVDNNLDTRELTHLHLTTEGFVVVVASDSREGLYMAVAEQPDLILTDISLPELSGIELVKQLRAEPQLDNVPILVLTGLGKEEMDLAIRAGAHRAMNKPVHIDSLMDEVRELLRESEAG
jgi:DNA-binding response OmpR family regulator